MSALFFLNKLFLIGLSAAVIPLLIHLFTRKKARKLSFSSVEFIRDVAQRETRRLRIRNLLLMVLRTAVICTFVLAMARPVLLGPLVKGEGTTAAVIVLDNSASMGSPKNGGNLFGHAGNVARELFVGLTDRDEGSLIPVCGTPESAALVGGGARLAGMVEFLELSNASSRPDEAIELAFSLLESSKSINRELYVVSDFQRSQWQKLEVSPAKEKGVRVVLVPVSTLSPENLSIEKAEVIPTGLPREQVLEFTVVNHGHLPAEGVPVRVTGDGDEIAVRYVDVTPGGTTTGALRLTGSFREIRILIPPDALPADNTYFLAMQPPGDVHILVLGDEQSARGTDFVSLALRPKSLAAEEGLWGFVPQRLGVDGLRDEHLRRAQCVVLDNVGRLSGYELDLLREFKNSGGRLLMALGDRVDIRHYNEKLLPHLFPARLVGVEGTADRHGSFFSLTAAIPSHPILRSFDVSRGEAICDARFYRLVRAEALEGSRVIAEFSEGLPAILEAEGALLFTGSFQPAWSDFVVSGAFPPLLHEMARYLCGGGLAAGRNFHPGDVLEEEIPVTQELPFSLRGPGDREVAMSRSRLGTAVFLKSIPVDEPGIYGLSVGDEKVRVFSVNLDPSESALRPLERKELLRVFDGASIVGGDSLAEAAGASRSGQELWPAFLVLCLGFMVAELLVARSVAPSK